MLVFSLQINNQWTEKKMNLGFCFRFDMARQMKIVNFVIMSSYLSGGIIAVNDSFSEFKELS